MQGQVSGQAADTHPYVSNTLNCVTVNPLQGHFQCKLVAVLNLRFTNRGVTVVTATEKEDSLSGGQGSFPMLYLHFTESCIVPCAVTDPKGCSFASP